MRGLGHYPKSLRAEFRELVGKANERDLSQALEALEAHFERWREGEIDAFELNDLIHQHHHGPSREIWKRYDGTMPEMTVAQAVVRGLLRPDELSPAMTEIVEPQVRFFNEIPDVELDETDEV
jgi:hypothetical protein